MKDIHSLLRSGKPLVMGILNVTQDSFFDGGKYSDVNAAVEKALQMAEEGADIIDIGGESTGPGSVDVPLAEELKRVIPVFEKLCKETDVILSVDTYKADVALHALNVGADMVNDVTALRGDEMMAGALAKFDCPVVIMFSKDLSARTSRDAREYHDVMKTVHWFLGERIAYGINQGIDRQRFVLDPGMGAFVSLLPQYSLQILKRLNELKDFELPVLVGPSRKSFIGQILNLSVNERLEGGLAACAVAVMNGASIVRTHDVKETRRVVDMVSAVMEA